MMETGQKIEMSEHSDPTVTQVKVKTPKRVLYFCDGTLEEFSDDEKEETQHTVEPLVDPKTLPWGPWMNYMLWSAGSATLAGCDYVGEWLASAFGITTPKYYFEIEESKRIEAEKKRLEERSQGWTETVPSDERNLVTKELGTSPAATATNVPALDSSQV